MRESCSRPTYFLLEELPDWLGDQGHHSIDLCCMLILDVAAIELHSSDLLQESLLPGPELIGSPIFPHHVNSEALLSLASLVNG